MNIGGHIEAKGPLTKNKHTQCLPQEDQVGVSQQYPDRGGPPGRGYPGKGIPDRGGPPGRGYHGGGPPDGGGPPGPPGGQGPLGFQGTAGPVRPIIVQMPQITLDTTALENTFDTVG